MLISPRLSWWWTGLILIKCYLPDFPLYIWSMALRSTLLGLSDVTWSSWFLQPEQNFLNHLVSMINCTFIFHAANVFDCFHSILAPSLNSLCISSQIRWHFMFIFVAFKSHIQLSNVQGVSASTTNSYLPSFELLQSDVHYQNIEELLTHPCNI